MTIEQKELAIQVGSQLVNTKNGIKQNLNELLDRVYGSLDKGVARGAVTLTADELISQLPEDVVQKLNADRAKIETFLASF
jgi:hypothetical protein